MKSKGSKLLTLGLVGVIAMATVLTGCGKKSADDAEHFTYFIGIGVDSQYADNYGELPAVQYWLDKEWEVDGEKKKITMDFTEAPQDSIQDNLNTMIATGEYPEVLNVSLGTTKATELYEEGIALDITEYVENYMPNYMAWIEDHPEYNGQLTTDGKYIQLFTLADSQEPPWGGWMYRRDWLVEYGKNPTTGAAFTGSWNEDKTEWTDDVVFPSGNTDPIYISDWEWMFDIFETAMKGEGITDGYAFQNYYTGWEGTGDLNCGFGGGMFGNYIGTDGKAHNGYVEEGARSFLECMNVWYEEGWMNQNFEENASDGLFFQIDTPSVFGGKVGMWYGLQATLGPGLDTGNNELTAGACVYGAAQPINDKYGDPSTQNVQPRNYYGTALAGAGIVITNKAEGKDIAALCKALDYLYGEEGAMLRRYGFSDEQQKELKNEFYTEHGIDGAYSVETAEDGTKKYLINQKIKSEDGLSETLGLIRVTGMSPFANVDQGQSPTVKHSVDQMSLYPVEGNLLTEPITTQLTPDQSTEWGTVNAALNTYLSQEVPKFIKGDRDITDDAEWDKYVQEVTDQKADLYAGYINDIIAKNSTK